MKRMLINATQKEEIRVAIVDGQRLYDMNIESPKYEQKKANIYKGRVIRIEPSLEAAFIDYGGERHGFLPLKAISREYYPVNYINNNYRANIKDILKEDQEIVVQIDKEERGSKGAALTTFISLAGSYLVLMPNNPRAGISRRIQGEDRNEIKEVLGNLKIPSNMGIIIRTSGMGKSFETLQWDLDFRLKHWNMIKKISKNSKTPFLIHQDSSFFVRTFRDYLRQDIDEILVDHPKVLELARNHISVLGRPDFSSKIKLYKGDVPLFSHYQIESQIESAFCRELRLPSGGSVVFDSTEALISIDINSSRSTNGGDIEETAFNTNLEAVEEIARQLRLRDLGGLIVIDFIDMANTKNQRIIESCLREAIQKDRARTRISSISRFGLLEMSRQRLSPSLRDSNYQMCSQCVGTGSIRDNMSLALAILRLIEEESLKKSTQEIHAIVPLKIALYLLNEKRDAINDIESRSKKVRCVILSNEEASHYSIYRIRKGEKNYSIQYLISNIYNKNTTKDIPSSVSNAVDRNPIEEKVFSIQKHSGILIRSYRIIKSFFAKKNVNETFNQIKVKQTNKKDNSSEERKKIDQEQPSLNKRVSRKKKKKAISCDSKKKEKYSKFYMTRNNKFKLNNHQTTFPESTHNNEKKLSLSTQTDSDYLKRESNIDVNKLNKYMQTACLVPEVGYGKIWVGDDIKNLDKINADIRKSAGGHSATEKSTCEATIPHIFKREYRM